RVPLQGLQSVTLAAGRRRAFKMNDLFDQAELSVMVESTAPVFVERALYRKGRNGISVTPLIPLA
ncbi:MAG TPA: hypothetical protein VM030_07675, partial [Acidimicrobiales bacterium]|nr:hypothetical protein [Acidimicrobiales bacterium]